MRRYAVGPRMTTNEDHSLFLYLQTDNDERKLLSHFLSHKTCVNRQMTMKEIFCLTFQVTRLNERKLVPHFQITRLRFIEELLVSVSCGYW